MKEKEAIYMKEDFTDEDGIKAAELEGEFATMNGWEAESDAENLLNGLGIGTGIPLCTDEHPVRCPEGQSFTGTGTVWKS